MKIPDDYDCNPSFVRVFFNLLIPSFTVERICLLMIINFRSHLPSKYFYEYFFLTCKNEGKKINNSDGIFFYWDVKWEFFERMKFLLNNLRKYRKFSSFKLNSCSQKVCYSVCTFEWITQEKINFLAHDDFGAQWNINVHRNKISR